MTVDQESSRASEVGGIKLNVTHFETCFSISACNKIFLFCLHVYFSSLSSSCSIGKTHSHFSPANGVFMFSLGTAPLGVAAYKNNLAQHFLQWKSAFFPPAISLLTDRDAFLRKQVLPGDTPPSSIPGLLAAFSQLFNINVDTHLTGRKALFLLLQRILESMDLTQVGVKIASV